MQGPREGGGDFPSFQNFPCIPFPFQSCFFNIFFFSSNMHSFSTNIYHYQIHYNTDLSKGHTWHVNLMKVIKRRNEGRGWSFKSEAQCYIHSWPIVPAKQEISPTLHCFLAHFDQKGQSLHFSLWHIFTKTDNHFISIGMQNAKTCNGVSDKTQERDSTSEYNVR